MSDTKEFRLVRHRGYYYISTYHGGVWLNVVDYLREVGYSGEEVDTLLLEHNISKQYVSVSEDLLKDIASKVKMLAEKITPVTVRTIEV